MRSVADMSTLDLLVIAYADRRFRAEFDECLALSQIRNADNDELWSEIQKVRDILKEMDNDSEVS